MEKKVSTKTLLSIVAVALVSFSGIMAETSMNVTFSTLAKTFNTNLNGIQWVTTAYLLAVTITVTISAYLVKKFSIRQLWLFGIITFTIGTIIGGLATNLPILILGRVLEGIAAGIAMPLTFNIVILTVPHSLIGTWMGISSMVVSLAPSFGPTYGGLIVGLLGWRAIFFILLSAPLLSFLLGWKTVGDVNPREKVASFDACAFILLAISLSTTLMLTNQLASGHIDWGMLIIACLTIIFFIWRGITSHQSFLNLALFKQITFVSLFLPIAFYMFAMLGLNLIIPTFVENVLHQSTFVAGFSLLPATLIGALFNPYFGRMYDQYGVKRPVVIGHVMFLIATLALAIWTQQLSLIMIMLVYTVFILGRNMVYNSIQTSAIDEQDATNKADATALIQTFQMFMGALGTTVGALYQSQFGFTNGFKFFSDTTLLIGVVNALLFWIFFKAQRNLTNQKI